MLSRYRIKYAPWPTEWKYPKVLGRNYFWDGWRKVWVESTPTYFPGHPSDWYKEECWDRTHPGPPYQSGGPLTIRKRLTPKRAFITKDYDLVSAGGGYRYVGKFMVIPSILEPDPLDKVALATHGSTGWNKFKPGKPAADLSVFLGELREFRDLFKVSIRKFYKIRNIANWHLAIQFGWLPMLRDLRKFYETWDTCQKRLDRIRKYNGRWERRGGVVAKGEETVESVKTALWTPTLPTPFHSGTAEQNHAFPRYIKRKYKVWFEAAFRYYIPDIGTKEWEKRAIWKLYGARVTPSVVWNLLPWSWLVDWFTNLGDVIENLDDGLAEGLSAAYAYVMRTQEVSYESWFTHTFNCRGGPVTVSADLEQPFVIKERAEASPYCIGLSDAILSIRQLSILAALGVTRFR